MKKALVWLLAMAFPAFGQGTIVFHNRNIPKAAGDGSTYNFPIYRCSGHDMDGGYVAGLFLPGASGPFATSLFRTDANGEFFLRSQVVVVPGGLPGERVTLEFRCWDIEGRTFLPWLTVMTLPLGGTNSTGEVFQPPGMTGLGNENGSGFTNTGPCGPTCTPTPAKLHTFQMGPTLQVSWQTCMEKKYQLQSRTLETDWINASAEFLGDNSYTGVNFPLTNSPAMSFFRVVELPK